MHRGNKFLWGYSQDADEELQRVFDYVLSKGVNWFDSADRYVRVWHLIDCSIGLP
jgi:aryl-alcohol dehydrogenase-like predicted oxidoreductase